MLYYRNQPPLNLFEDQLLTAAYADNRNTIPSGGFSKLSLDISYAMGGAESANTLEFQLEASSNGTDWFVLVIDSTTTVSEITPRAWQMDAGNLNILVDIAYPHMRFSMKESGVAANFGTASVTATLSGL